LYWDFGQEIARDVAFKWEVKACNQENAPQVRKHQSGVQER
jgi:hypothetical protein